MNFVMLPKYLHRQYLLIKAATLVFYTECLETQVAKLTQILCTVPYDTQPSDCIKYSAIFIPLHNHPNKPTCDVKFAPRFCVVSRWLPANKSMVFDQWCHSNVFPQDLVFFHFI